MSGAELPDPIAEGSLASRPFAHLLLFIQQRGLNGTLVLWQEEGAKQTKRGQDRLRFERGRAVAARFVYPGSTFERSMLQLFTRVHAPYAFYDRDLVGTGAAVLTSAIEPAAMIAASLRGAAREDAIDAVLRRLGQTFIRIQSDANLTALGLNAREKNFVDLIRADATTADRLVQISGDERSARRLLYLLTITRCIESFKRDEESEGEEHGDSKFGPVSIPHGTSEAPPFASIPPASGAATRPRTPVAPARTSTRPGASSRPPRARRDSKRPPSKRPAAPDQAPPVPSDLSPELAARWKEVATFANKLDKMTYFEMLDIKQTVKGADISTAYLSKVKTWHPDRLPKELAALRPSADRIFHHLTKAKEILSDKEERNTYLRNVAEGGGTPESERQVSAIIESAMAVQRAEVMLKQSDWQSALDLARDAQELSPDNGESLAIEAWARFQLQRCEAPYGEILTLLERAATLNKNSQKAHYYRGVVLQRTGDDAKAIAEFQKVIAINPRHTEAMRQVRVANMRGGGSKKKTTKKDDGGFLSKLFGGDTKSKSKSKSKSKKR